MGISPLLFLLFFDFFFFYMFRLGQAQRKRGGSKTRSRRTEPESGLKNLSLSLLIGYVLEYRLVLELEELQTPIERLLLYQNLKLKIGTLKMFEFESRLDLSLKGLTLMESQNDKCFNS